MSDQLTNALARQFSDNFKLVAQQMVTEMRAKMTVVTDIKERKYLDYVGIAGEPEAQLAAVEATNLTEIPHTRRLIRTFLFNKAVALPKAYQLRMLADPINPYLQALKATFERFLEKRAFIAAIGNSVGVTTEDLTEANIPLPAAQIITETGTVGMTANKIIRSLTTFNLNNREKSEKMLGLSAQAIEDLFLDPDVTAIQEKALDLIRTGQMTTQPLWGFNVMMSNVLPKTAVGAGIRSNVAWCKEGLGLGLNEDYNVSIDKRPDLKNIYQIFPEMDFGCTRLAETDVVEIQAYESY
jgi:hypothetical protein